MVQTDSSSIVYVGNNSTTAPYPVPYNFFTDADLVVTVKDALGVEELQILNTDYTVTGEGDPNGGALVMTWPVPATSFVSIVRDIAATQLTSYEEADAFPAKSHEKALDKLTMLVQQALRVTGGSSPTDLGRAFRLTDASVGINAVAKLNDTMLGLDSAGNAILRTAGDMLAWLGQVGTVWADTAERLLTRGAYAGQVGVQLDNYTIYIAQSDTPGDWVPFLLGTGIIGATDGVPHLMTPPAGDLVGTEQSQTLYNKTLESPTIHTPTGLTKNDVGLSQVDNTSDLNKPLSSATGAALAFKQDKSEKGISNGYPSLDGGGKIPTVQLPDSVVGASQYKGTWNASINSPSITTGSAPGKTGWYYSVAVAGTTTVDGISSWAVGDQIISNGTVWQKIPNVSAVSSVNSKTGAVVLVPADISLGNVDNTSDATKNAAAVTLTNKTINGANNTLTVRLDADVINNLPVNRLNNGTGASGTTWWCGDGSWKQPPGTGDVSGPVGAGDGELCLYSGTTGKIIRRFSGTAGFAKAGTTGLLTTQAKIMAADVDKDVIVNAPRITVPEWNDLVWISETSDSGLLKSITYADAFPLPRNWLAGMTIANSVSDTANDIDVAVGEARSDDNTGDIVLTSPLTKRLDAAWAAGTNQGGRDTGAIGDATWHVFAIRNPTTNVCDVLFSQSLAAPTMPSGFTQKRRIGSMVRLAAPYGGLQPIRQLGDYFQINAALRNESLTTATGGNNLITLTSVPSGLKWCVDTRINLTNSAGTSQTRLNDPDQPDGNSIVLVTSSTANQTVAGAMSLWCTAARIVNWAIPFNPGTGTCTLGLYVAGWNDPRGKDR